MGRGFLAAVCGLAVLATSFGAFELPSNSVPMVLFSDDFENPWNSAWVAYDEDPVGGEDTWGVTEFAYRSGSHSAGAAVRGTNSRDGLPNIYSKEVNGSLQWVARYDDGMHASLDLRIGPSTGYASRTLEFFFAAHTEPWIVDYLSVLALVGTTWTTLWTQNVTLTSTFYPVRVSIPPSAEWISFYFWSDETESSYAGAFIDDVVVTGEWIGGEGSAGFRPLGPGDWLVVLGITAAGAGTGASVAFLASSRRGKTGGGP